MRYLIMKGNLHSIELLPARATTGEAQSEVDRLEKNRADNNAAALVPPDKTKHGWSFLHPRMDNDKWWIKEIA